MEAIIDIARDYKIFIPTDTELHAFDMPSRIRFDKGDEQNVEVRVGTEEEGNFSLTVDSSNFSGFSPNKNLAESFKSIFDYYFYHTVNKKVAGEPLQELQIIVPFSFSISFENLLHESIGDKCHLRTYRDIEVYSAYYLEDTLDLPEIKRFAQEDEDAHVYGIITTGDIYYIACISYCPGQPPKISDVIIVNNAQDIVNTFKMLIKKHSTEKSRIFFFVEGDTRAISNIFEGESPKKTVQVEIEPGKKMPVRMLRKKSLNDNPLIQGIQHLKEKPELAPLFIFSLFSQESRTGFTEIPLDKELDIAIKFPKSIPREFFINFFVGTNPANLILLGRIFVDIGDIMEKQLLMKGNVEQIDKLLKINLQYQDKINEEAFFQINKKYRLSRQMSEIPEA